MNIITKIDYIIYPIIIGLMIGWLVSSVLTNIYIQPKSKPKANIVSTNKQPPINEIVNSIIEKNIFLLSIKPITEVLDKNSNNGSISATPFQGKLLGIIYSENDNTGIAIIYTDGATLSISVGKSKNGIKLISIKGVEAIVEKNNIRYTLTLDSIGYTPTPSNNIDITKNGNTNNISTKGSNINVGLTRSDVETELKDLNKILQSALVSPYYEGGQYKGYRVSRMREDSPLKKLGLKTGDVIARINGNDLKSPELLFNMLSQLDDITAISIDMIRNNEKKTIFVEIQ